MLPRRESLGEPGRSRREPGDFHPRPFPRSAANAVCGEAVGTEVEREGACLAAARPRDAPRPFPPPPPPSPPPSPPPLPVPPPSPPTWLRPGAREAASESGPIFWAQGSQAPVHGPRRLAAPGTLGCRPARRAARRPQGVPAPSGGAGRGGAARAATMEPQRRELLAQCQQSLAQAMTEVETVLGLLEAAGALSPGERRQLDEEAGGAKAELLLQLLLAKEQDHFQDLRAALEKTQPHLLPILYLNGVVGPPQSAEGAGEWQSRGPSCPPATPSLCSSQGAGGWGEMKAPVSVIALPVWPG